MIKYAIFTPKGLPLERNGIMYLFQDKESAEDTIDNFLASVLQKPVRLGSAQKDGYKIKKVRLILEELG